MRLIVLSCLFLFILVVNINASSPNVCSFFPGLACTDYEIKARDDLIILHIKNGIGDTIIINSISVYRRIPNYPNQDEKLKCLGPIRPQYPFNINDGEEVKIEIGGCGINSKNIGTRFRAEIEVEYKLANNEQIYKRTGDLIGTIPLYSDKINNFVRSKIYYPIFENLYAYIIVGYYQPIFMLLKMI